MQNKLQLPERSLAETIEHYKEKLQESQTDLKATQQQLAESDRKYKQLLSQVIIIKRDKVNESMGPIEIH